MALFSLNQGSVFEKFRVSRFVRNFKKGIQKVTATHMVDVAIQLLRTSMTTGWKKCRNGKQALCRALCETCSAVGVPVKRDKIQSFNNCTLPLTQPQYTWDFSHAIRTLCISVYKRTVLQKVRRNTILPRGNDLGRAPCSLDELDSELDRRLFADHSSYCVFFLSKILIVLFMSRRYLRNLDMTASMSADLPYKEARFILGRCSLPPD